MNLQLYQEMAFDTPVGKVAKTWLRLHWHEWVEVVGSDSLAQKIVVEMVWGFGFQGWKSGSRAIEEWNRSSDLRGRVAGDSQRSRPGDRETDAGNGQCKEISDGIVRGRGTVMTDIGPVPREFVMFDNFMQQCMLDISSSV